MTGTRRLGVGFVAFFVLWVTPGQGQSNGEQLRFEAASVKLHTIGSPSTGRSGVEETPGLIRIENLPLKVVIGSAYGVRDYLVEGPVWLRDISVDITAKPPAGYEHKQLAPLVRNLLAERFHMKAHQESKETAGYALVIAKGG